MREVRTAYLNETNRIDQVQKWKAGLRNSRGRGVLPADDCPALVIVDVQRLFCDPLSLAFLPAWPVCALNVSQLLAVWRTENWPVFFTRHVQDPHASVTTFDHFFSRRIVESDPFSELTPYFAAVANETEILSKDRHAAWCEPEKFAQSRIIVLVGVQTQLCVLATAIEASRFNKVGVVAMDACAAPNEELHLAALQVLSAGHAFVKSTGEILAHFLGGEQNEKND